MKLGAIEAGGTKFVVCIGNEKGEVLERESFPTEAPEKTMENVFKFFDGKEIEVMAGDYERITKNGIYDGMKIKVTYDGKVKKASDLKNRKLLKMEEID